MAKRAIHYDDYDGGTEAGHDEPEQTFCGTEGEFEEHHFTRHRDQVTCKRCLKIFSAQDTERAAEQIRYKAELYDEVWAQAKALGFMNVATALDVLSTDAELHTQIQRAAGELPKGWTITLGIENGAGWVELEDQHGAVIETSAEGHLSEQVADALETAFEHA